MASEPKKPKLDENGSAAENVPDKQEELTSFSGFKMTKILSESSERKNVCVEGTFSGDRRSIVVLERLPLRAEILPQIFQVWIYTLHLGCCYFRWNLYLKVMVMTLFVLWHCIVSPPNNVRRIIWTAPNSYPYVNVFNVLIFLSSENYSNEINSSGPLYILLRRVHTWGISDIDILFQGIDEAEERTCQRHLRPVRVHLSGGRGQRDSLPQGQRCTARFLFRLKRSSCFLSMKNLPSNRFFSITFFK